MAEQRIRWIVHIPDDAFQLMRDPVMIENRVLGNFIENAARHTSANGLVEVGYRIDACNFIGYVRDTGSGIKPENLSSLFKPGAQLSGQLRGLAGWGLYSAKSVIEAHNGKVSVESQWGIGSKFSFQIPLHGTLSPQADLA